MDELFTTSTPQDTLPEVIRPNQSAPLGSEPDPSPSYTPKPAFPLWLAAAIAILIGGGLFFTWQTLQSKGTKPTEPAPTPTVTPTPSLTRQISSLASQRAFLSLQSEVASLSGAIDAYVVEDPSLSPPVIDLPVGFTR